MSDSQLTTDPGYQTLVDRFSAIYAEGQLQAHRAVFSTNGVVHISPGQRPGYASSFNQALKGRPNRCLAPSGLGMFLTIEPRALPWAGISRPFWGYGRRRPSPCRLWPSPAHHPHRSTTTTGVGIMNIVGEKMPRLLAERHAQRLSLLERAGVRALGTAKITIKANLENLCLKSKP